MRLITARASTLATRADSAIWGLARGPVLSLHLRGWVAFRRTAAMASASSSCPVATLITRS